MGLFNGVRVLYTSAAIFPIAILAWALMWVTDRLYESGLGLIAVPIRIVIILLQLSFLVGCAGAALGIVVTTAGLFWAASQGRDPYSEGRMRVSSYLMLLLLSIAMGVAGALVAVFHNWMDFNERGLGLITLGARLFTSALQLGSVLVLLLWLVVLPVFLWRRRQVAVA